jgi:hypothetical protein
MAHHEKMEGKPSRSEGKLRPVPQIRAQRSSFKMETHADLGSGGDGRNPAPTNPAAMEEPRVTAAAAAPSLDALPAPNQVRSHLLTATPLGTTRWIPCSELFLKICGI